MQKWVTTEGGKKWVKTRGPRWNMEKPLVDVLRSYVERLLAGKNRPKKDFWLVFSSREERFIAGLFQPLIGSYLGTMNKLTDFLNKSILPAGWPGLCNATGIPVHEPRLGLEKSYRLAIKFEKPTANH